MEGIWEIKGSKDYFKLGHKEVFLDEWHWSRPWILKEEDGSKLF